MSDRLAQCNSLDSPISAIRKPGMELRRRMTLELGEVILNLQRRVDLISHVNLRDGRGDLEAMDLGQRDKGLTESGLSAG
jgi:hypothetical protein